MELGKHSLKLMQLRKAVRQGELTADGLLPVEGPILLEEAHRSGIEVVDVFIRRGTRTSVPPLNQVYEISPDTFKTIQETEHSQGIVATVRPRHFTLDDMMSSPSPLIMVLARLQDPGNVGTILRVSEAFGATGCVALRGTAGFYNSKAARASAGSVFRLPNVGGVDFDDLVVTLKKKNIRIVGTSPSSASSVETWDWRTPTALIVGNEGSGLSAEELKYCDAVLRIPHSDTVESLNSAIAAAVIMYEASKQRR